MGIKNRKSQQIKGGLILAYVAIMLLSAYAWHAKNGGAATFCNSMFGC